MVKPAYANLGARAEALCKLADEAVAEVANATQAYRVFRLTGEYKEFVDKLNLARKDVYGALGKLPHSDQGQGLPSDFANDFFKHETRRNKKVTIEMLRGRIENLKEELEAQMTVLAAMEAAGEVFRRKREGIYKRVCLWGRFGRGAIGFAGGESRH